MSATPVLPQTPKHGVVQIVNADASNSKTLVSDPGGNAKIAAIYFTSDDTSNRVVQIRVTRGGTDYLVASVTVTALAGSDGTVNTINGFSGATGLPVDQDNQVYLFIVSGDTITIKATTTVTSGKTIHAHCDYSLF